MGLQDGDLQELPEDAERQRVMQAPNRKGVWSRSQQPRERAMSGPRFEQTLMEFQVGFLVGGPGSKGRDFLERCGLTVGLVGG